jgi:hypothetical protein
MSKSLKIAAFAAVTAMVFALPAQADRRSGLNGNVLIEDYNDVFTYPQRAGNAMNTNRVRINHAGGNASDATIFVKKGNGGWGVGVNATTPANTDPSTPTSNSTMAEFAYSGGDWGVAARIGKGAFTQDGDGNTAMAIGIVGGYSLKDTAELGLSFQILTAEDGAATTYSNMNVGLNARGYQGSGVIKTGWTAAVGIGMGKIEPDGGEAAETSAMNVELGAGPVYSKDSGVVALHATLGYSTDEDAAKTKTSSIVLPGVNLGFETKLNDWVDFRAGAGYKFVMTTVTPDGGDDTVINHADGGLENGAFVGAPTGAMGLSAKWDALTFDVNLNRDFVNNGPYLLTGATTASWAGNVAATYKF